MRILVTGATGFIGGHVVMQLARTSEHQIIATGRTATNRFKDLPNVTFLAFDLTQPLPELPCDVCIHAAGLATDQSTYAQLEAANVTATQQLIKSIKGCQCLIYISSSSVYDFTDGIPKSEADDQQQDGVSAYGQTKYLGEGVARQSGIPAVYILRPRAVYGPGDRLLLPRILKLIKGNRMWVPGPLLALSSMTHVENLHAAIVRCMLKMQSGIHTYNVADATPYKLIDAFSEICYRATGHRNVVHIPMAIVSLIITITKLLGIKSVMTRQAIDYLNHNSVLKTDRIVNELEYLPTRTFFDNQPDLKLPPDAQAAL